MKNYTITVNGTAYNVTVQEGANASAPAAAPAPAPAAAPAPGSCRSSCTGSSGFRRFS